MSVHANDDGSRGRSNRCIHSCRDNFPGIVDQANPRIPSGKPCDHILRVVNGTSIRDNNLEPIRRRFLRYHGLEAPLDVVHFIATRNDNGHARPGTRRGIQWNQVSRWLHRQLRITKRRLPPGVSGMQSTFSMSIRKSAPLAISAARILSSVAGP